MEDGITYVNDELIYLINILLVIAHFLDFTFDSSNLSYSSNNDFMTSSNVWLTVPNFASLECVWSLTFIDLNSGGSGRTADKRRTTNNVKYEIIHTDSKSA